MSRPTRRELLGLIGATGASAGLGVIASACGGTTRGAKERSRSIAPNLRGRLRVLIDELEGRYQLATALAITGRRIEVARDASENGVVVTELRRLLLQVFDGTSWYAQATDDLSPGSLVATVDRLTQRIPGGRPGERRTRDARSRNFFRRGGIELSTGAGGWQSKLGELFEATQLTGSSRVVYRGSYFRADDVQTLFIGDGQDLRQSITRSRAGSVFVARDGRETITEEASRSGTIGLEVMRLSADELSAAARRVLTVPAGPPSASVDTNVILTPAIVAAVVRVGLAAHLDARSWQRGESILADYLGDQIADSRFTLVDDPTRARGYSSYDFDDEGWLSSPRTLVHRGVLRGPFTDRSSAGALGVGRTGHARASDRGLPRPHHSNLVIEPGGASMEELVADVASGLVIEGPLLAECDPLRWRVLVRARRGREVKNGSFTGRVVGPISVRSTLESLLLAVRGVSRASETHLTSGTPPGSITAPTILTRAEVG